MKIPLINQGVTEQKDQSSFNPSGLSAETDSHAPSRFSRYLKRFLLAVIAIVTCLACAFFIWTSQFYHADQKAAGLMHVPGIIDHGSYIELDRQLNTQSFCTSEISAHPDKAIIFYPGAKVEPEAYLPLLTKLRAQGVTGFIVRMPFNLAILNPSAADQIIKDHPEITDFYLAGHSMGGAMASVYASDHQQQVRGLILLGAYVYGSYPHAQALTIYGSLNTSIADHLTPDDKVVVIPGGNHAQFGNYGAQKGDAQAEISADQQQDEAVLAIMDYLK